MGAVSVERGARKRDRTIEVKGDPAFFRRVNVPAVLAGFAVALLVYLGLIGLLAGPGGSQVNLYFGVSAVAMYAGGLTAGTIEPKYGVLNGPLVAVLFIAVSAILTFSNELELVQKVGPFGLGPMRVDKVFATDIPQLLFSTLGGLTAGWIERGYRAPRRAEKRKNDGGKRAG